MQSLVCLLATAVGISIMAVVPNLVGIIAGLLVAGSFQAVVMVTRNLSLRESLPANAHTGGYSLQYAVQGVGYSLSAIFAGLVLDRSTPNVAVLGGVAITVLLVVISTVAERAGVTGAARAETDSAATLSP